MSANPNDPEPAHGTDFPLINGRRSSTALGKLVFSAAAEPVDAALAARIRAVDNWRKDYLAPCRDLVAVAAQSSDNAVAVANEGLGALHERFVFGDAGEERPLGEAITDPQGPGLQTVRVSDPSCAGLGPAPLSVPYRGSDLQGHALLAQVHTWIDEGTAEPSLGKALGALVDEPSWMDLRNTHVALLGAGAELGPLRHLLSWGAHVWAVDLPRPSAWTRILDAVRGTAGTLHVPVPAGVDLPPEGDHASLAQVAGADIIRQAPQIRSWLDEIPEEFVLGNYGYADGALHVRLSIAADAIAADLLATGRSVTLAYLATPTDAFAVPADAVAMSRERWRSNKVARATRRPMKLANLFQPNYKLTVRNEFGHEVGIADCIVPQQGPNYLLAKRLQRFRAVVARQAGHRVSLNVAPATRTQSVVKNRALAAAYAGAGRFGIEVFQPDTCNALMAALLVRDLRDSASVTNPAQTVDNPMDLYADAANHGGLWRAAYDPRSVLGVAAVLGMFERRA